MSVSINVKDVVKKYGDVTIIPDLSTTIKNGEFFTLLGPSGCGKTTLLRMIAGFNSIEGGTIAFDEKVINDTPAQNRNIGMVFQSYAIFPHLTVRQNVEYGLKIRKVPKAEMKQRVDEILKIVKIEEYQDRLPERLSGGQQQRADGGERGEFEQGLGHFELQTSEGFLGAMTISRAHRQGAVPRRIVISPQPA